METQKEFRIKEYPYLKYLIIIACHPAFHIFMFVIIIANSVILTLDKYHVDEV